MKMGKLDEALVEVRRMDIKLRQLQDRYSSELKYRDDAFLHLLMGLVYDATLDFNNAFIAYRNALETYRNFYSGTFDIQPPDQLKADLVRTAYQSGFFEEAAAYEDEFNLTYESSTYSQTQVVFFWNNGLGPVKEEWGVNFTAVKGEGGAVIFQNAEYGYSFPFIWSDQDNDNVSFDDIRVTRVVFPKYVERPALFDRSFLRLDGQEYPLELAEDVNAIAFKVLEQRFLKEMGKTLLRVAIKKGSEAALREENENLATVLSIVNAATEKADTRNWQTLPHSIYYARIPVSETDFTTKKFYFKTVSPYGSRYDQVHELEINVTPGKTTVHTFSSLEAADMYMRDY
jgi:hypothetical protein